MILGIGTDILNICRIEKLLKNFENKFIKKILSPSEIKEYQTTKYKNSFVAKKFCVKESILKALGIGMGRGIKLNDITIQHDKLGKPLVLLSKNSEKFVLNFYNLNENNIQIDISISDEELYVVAFAIVSLKI